MKEIATGARTDMERLFGGKVFLEVVGARAHAAQGRLTRSQLERARIPMMDPRAH